MRRIPKTINRFRAQIREKGAALPLRVSITAALTLYIGFTYFTLSEALVRLERQKFLHHNQEEATALANRLTHALSAEGIPRSRRQIRDIAQKAGIRSAQDNPNIAYIVLQDLAGHTMYAPKVYPEFAWMAARTSIPAGVDKKLLFAGTATRRFYSYDPKCEIWEVLTAVRGQGNKLVGVVRLGLNETALLHSASQLGGQVLSDILGVNLLAILGAALVVFWLMTRFETPMFGLYERAKKVAGVRPPALDQRPSGNVVTMLESELEHIEGLVKKLRETQTETATTLSHELRPPLQVIVGYVAVPRHGGAGPISREVDQYLKNIEETAKDFETFMDNVLDMARLEEGSLPIVVVPVSAELALRKCFRMFEKRTQNDNMRLLEETTTGTRLVLCDEGRLVQVLVNLLSNAF